jgi:hypothetical protein
MNSRSGVLLPCAFTEAANAIWEAHGKPLHVILPNGAVNLSYRKRIDPRARSEKGVPRRNYPWSAAESKSIQLINQPASFGAIFGAEAAC